MHDEKIRSLENSLRIWERRNDFLELGTETLETGDRIRDFLFLDSEFLKNHEERLKGFDEKLTIEYGVGVVTLIGDRMKDSPGIASIAIGAIPEITIKRGILAPHTSQIILVVEEKNIDATVAAIHLKRDEMNRPSYEHKPSGFKDDDYASMVAKNVEETYKLVEAGFEYICDMGGFKIFRKHK